MNQMKQTKACAFCAIYVTPFKSCARHEFREKLMKKQLFLFFATLLCGVCLFSSCEKKVTTSGLAPNNISGKSITLSGASRTIDFTSNSSGVIWVGNSGKADRVRNVSYQKISEDEAKISFSWYESDKSKPYALDETWEVTLTFATENTGVWGGTCTSSSWSYNKQNSNNKRSNYSGKIFSVN